MSTIEKIYLKEFGKYLKKKRLKMLNKSLRLLAFECDIDPSILSRLENGQRMANIFTLKRLATAFNMSIGKFLDVIEKDISDDIKNFDI